MLHGGVTQQVGVEPEKCFTIPVMAQGRAALSEVNKSMGLGFDDQDLDFYTQLFTTRLKR